ncbi:MAG: hypothetical protein OZ948_16295 [Deltaproteobacteria bacterium]|nr:hypothetical protein [Deltaproteobacteria bacterium]
MRAGRALAGLALGLLAGAGCALETVPHGRFAALTTRTAPVLGYQIDEASRTRDVEAVVLSQHFLWVPTRTDPPTLAEAVEQALRRGNGDLLVDVEVDRLFFAVPLLYGQEGWRVRGDVVRTHPEAGQGAAAGQAASPAPSDPSGAGFAPP